MSPEWNSYQSLQNQLLSSGTETNLWQFAPGKEADSVEWCYPAFNNGWRFSQLQINFEAIKKNPLPHKPGLKKNDHTLLPPEKKKNILRRKDKWLTLDKQAMVVMGPWQYDNILWEERGQWTSSHKIIHAVRITSYKPAWALQQDPVGREGTNPNLFPSNSMSSISVERTACYCILT